MKTEGLNLIRQLCKFHANVFNPPVLHSVILAVVNEVKNLRSQVSRLAIVCFADMFQSLKKGMDAVSDHDYFLFTPACCQWLRICQSQVDNLLKIDFVIWFR